MLHKSVAIAWPVVRGKGGADGWDDNGQRRGNGPSNTNCYELRFCFGQAAIARDWSSATADAAVGSPLHKIQTPHTRRRWG